MAYALDLTTRVLIRKNGVLLFDGPNFVTKAGRSRLAALINQDSNLVPGYMAIGDDGSATTDLTSALLGTEHERVSATLTRQDNLLSWEASFGSSIVSSVTVRELGILDASSGGLLLSRVRPADFTVVPSDVINVAWNLRLGDP